MFFVSLAWSPEDGEDNNKSRTSNQFYTLCVLVFYPLFFLLYIL